jgi:hypothetical protein
MVINFVKKSQKKGKKEIRFFCKKTPAQQPGPKEPQSGVPPSAAGRSRSPSVLHPAARVRSVLSLPTWPPLSISARLRRRGYSLQPPPYARCRGLRRSLRRRRHDTHQVFPALLFPFMLCETEHPNPKLSYDCLMPTNFELSEIIIPLSGVHVYTVHPCPSLVPPP